jgi:Xaa-Pro aminopeptidase
VRSEESIKRRIRTILNEVGARGFDTAVFVNEIIGQSPSNFIYVSGTWGYGEEHTALILGTDGRSTVVMPHWGAPRMEEKGLYDRVVPVKQEKGHHIRAMKEALERYHDARNICFDLSTMSSQFTLQLLKALRIELNEKLDISDCLFKLRAIKDEYEIEEIRKATGITEEAVLELASNARPGTSTVDLKKRMDASMIERGAVEFSFESTLSFASVPARPPGLIKHGDMLAVDVGCRVPSGYCSDMGRNIPVSPGSEVKEFLDRAVKAHRESIKLIGDGVIASDVLEGSNRINKEYGFDPMVRCGHQIGLECHDYIMPFAPNFGSIDEDRQPLKAGMTLTYEPPHSDPKKGLRTHLEDVVLVTKGEPIILNELPWDFLW